MFCLIFLLGHNIPVTELMAKLSILYNWPSTKLRSKLQHQTSSKSAPQFLKCNMWTCGEGQLNVKLSLHAVLQRPNSKEMNESHSLVWDCDGRYVLSSSDSLIPFSMWLKRQAGQEGNRAHAAPNIFNKFKKQCLVTHRPLRFLWSNLIFNKQKL